jgi:protein-(glutamine-N5) methyltransferase, release factor-specific
MTFRNCLNEGMNALEKIGIVESRVDAWILFENAFNIDKKNFLLCQNEIIPNEANEQCDNYYRFIEFRKKRIPVQYIIGEQEFMGIKFKVNENVLIPRQDTEILVNEILNDCKLEQHNTKELKVLDLCTGSGCIGISLKLLGEFLEVNCADISDKALDVAKENIKKLCAEVNIIKGDLFERCSGKIYDIIVSNPPYIKSLVIEGLEPEVKDNEPILALDGMEDGLFFYKKIIAQAKNYMTDLGRIYFEIGHDQGDDVKYLLEIAGFTNIEIIKDMAGLDRVVKAIIKA